MNALPRPSSRQIEPIARRLTPVIHDMIAAELRRTRVDRVVEIEEEISVDERNPHTGFERRYVLKHRWLWEKKHGPVPDGMVLKSRDGDKRNTEPSNWELIPRALLPRLGGRYGRDYDHAPAELKPTIMAVAKLEQAALDARKAGTS